MSERFPSSHIRIFPPIYRREFLGDQELYVQLGDKHVHLLALLERIPNDVLLQAVEALDRDGKVFERIGSEINPGRQFPAGSMATPETR